MAKSFLNNHFHTKNIKKIPKMEKNGEKFQKIWKCWFTKSGVWILKSLIYLQFLLHKKSVSRDSLLNRENLLYLRLLNMSPLDCR